MTVDPLVLTSIVDGLADLGSSAVNAQSQYHTNMSNQQMNNATNTANLQIAENTNAMNQALNEANIAFQERENAITREREDNAVRRRAIDLASAGLSKTLAAGSAASSNALQAPQNTFAMQTGNAMKAHKSTAPQFDFHSNFTENLYRAKSADLEDKRLDIEDKKADIERDSLDETIRHNKALETESARSNLATEEENKRYHNMQSFWKSAELNQNDRFHFDALKIQSAELELKDKTFLTDKELKEHQMIWYDTQSALNKVTSYATSAKLTSELAEMDARSQAYLADVELSQAQIDYLKSQKSLIAEEISEAIARTKNYDANTALALERGISEVYDRTIAEQEGTTTTGTVVSDSVASENKANRKVDLAGKGITAVSSLIGVGLGAFLGSGGAKFVLQKMFDDTHRPMGFHK